MEGKKNSSNSALAKCEQSIKQTGLAVQYTRDLDPFFKGDLDGKTILIAGHLGTEEKLFNLLHLAGHSIQWNIDKQLRKLGSELYSHPDDTLLKKLQAYEWQANCYGLSILHKAGIADLDEWLTRMYILDMVYLTHFYKTGEKSKRVTAIAGKYAFGKDLEIIPVPLFSPVACEKTRNGIVI